MDRRTLEEISAHGIELVATVEAPWGGISVVLTPEDVEPFIRDRAEWFAGKNGAFKNQYLDWIESSGTPRCGAKTAKGNRCKNFVSGGIQRSFEVWLQEDGGFCVIHGGEPSRRR